MGWCLQNHRYVPGYVPARREDAWPLAPSEVQTVISSEQLASAPTATIKNWQEHIHHEEHRDEKQGSRSVQIAKPDTYLSSRTRYEGKKREEQAWRSEKDHDL